MRAIAPTKLKSGGSMKNRLKISENDFKQYLLNHYIDDEGLKVSDRVVWGTEEFFEYTGMYSINKFTGDRKMVSTGTVSYWKEKLKVKEQDVYEYHKHVSKKIKNDISFEEWSRKNNKGYNKDVTTYNRETIKRKLVKYAELPPKYQYKTLDELVTIVLKTWETLGLDAQEEMSKFYKHEVM